MIANEQAVAEEWRPVVGFEGHYDVSNLGNVRSWKRRGGGGDWKSERAAQPRPLAPGLNKRGYLSVVLCLEGKTRIFRIHKLVAAEFIGPRPEGMQVCHNNGDPGDNRASNLRYDTPKNNSWDKQAHGTQVRGETCGQSKVSEADVLAMRRRRRAGEKVASIAEDFPVTSGTVAKIVGYRQWKHIA